MSVAEFGRPCSDDPGSSLRSPGAGGDPGDAPDPAAASVTARAPSSPEFEDNNLSTNDHFTKTKIPTADAGAASHRRLQPIEQVVPCCCRRSPRARA